MTPFSGPEPAFDAAATEADDEAFVVDVDGFAGPIDLLLSLARQQKVDLSRISIVQLADQYLAFIADARRRSLTLAAEYLVMAAWLAYLKSRLLLPPPRPIDDEPEPEVLAAALARQLERLDAMRRVGRRLLALPQEGRDVFLRPASPVSADGAASAPPEIAAGTCTLAQLLAAYARQIKRRHPPVAVIDPLPLMSVDEALARIRASLGHAPGWESLLRYLPAEILDGGAAHLAARSALAATFVACLELARNGALRIRQARPFGPIFVIAEAASAQAGAAAPAGAKREMGDG